MKRIRANNYRKPTRASTRSTFTLIADFAGGTYISQLRASTPARAVALWAKSFDFSVMSRLPIAALPEFRADITSSTPVPLDGTKGVWCSSASLGRRFLLLNIVHTATQDARKV